MDGRIVIIDKHGRVTPVARDLQKPEGIAIASDGRVYVAESGKGRILRLADGELQTLVGGLNRPDQITITQDGTLWITEDRTSGRVLRYADGILQVIAEGVSKPQGIAIDDAGWVYVAEQGRNRIIRLRYEG